MVKRTNIKRNLVLDQGLTSGRNCYHFLHQILKLKIMVLGVVEGLGEMMVYCESHEKVPRGREYRWNVRYFRVEIRACISEWRENKI